VRSFGSAAIRNIVAVTLVGALLATFHVFSRRDPKVYCTGIDSNSFYCSASLEYPPEQPTYVWTVDEAECIFVDGRGQPAANHDEITVRVSTVAPEHKCTVHLAVFDSAGQLLGKSEIGATAAYSPVAIRATTSAPSVPEPAKPVPRSRPATLTVGNWPDNELRRLADLVPIQGTVNFDGPSKYRVLVYTLVDGLWVLQGSESLPPGSRNWSVFAHFGQAWAVLLVKPSHNDQTTMKSLPRVGGNVLDVKKTL
jgi:hypothetical protein